MRIMQARYMKRAKMDGNHILQEKTSELELEDEIFLPYPSNFNLSKVRLSHHDDSAISAGTSEWVDLPLESDPLPQTFNHIVEPQSNNVVRTNCRVGLGLNNTYSSLSASVELDHGGTGGTDSEPGINDIGGLSGITNIRQRLTTLSGSTLDSDTESPIDLGLRSPSKCGSLFRDSSILDGLLCEIYDRCQLNSRYSIDSDGFTEYSSNSEGAYLSSKGDSFQESTRLPKALLNSKSISDLSEMVRDLQHSVAVLSGRLIKQLKRRDRYLAKLNKNQDVLTAVLQAVSQKRRVDAKLKFSIEPLPGKRAFSQWYDALRAVGRLPKGLPQDFRKSVWLSLANRHIAHLKLDWPKTVRFTFNDRSNPDDDTLGLQIVKDLHRTGCSGFCGQDAEDDRVVLKRVLLAYARWNKAVGYCQGFNVLAALILEVMERVEDDALKVMIFLIDHVLPDSYFSNNLRALSVDMAVFRDLLHFKLPELAQHLDRLQKTANDGVSGSYEPPLTNVFTMQWFLTLFATCLPKDMVLRVWDSIFLEGSEILLRVALAIWAKLGNKLLDVDSADEFYSTMGLLCTRMLKDEIIGGDELIQTIYSMAPFPFPHLNEIREKYMFSITPFTPMGSISQKPETAGKVGGGSSRGSKKEGGKSDEDGDLNDDEAILTCFPSIFPLPMSPVKGRLEAGDQSSTSSNDITCVSPGAYGASTSEDLSGLSAAMLERMNVDICSLKKQYWKIQRRQQQAHVIYGPGNKDNDRGRRHREPRKSFSTSVDSPSAINHLLIGKHGLGRKNRKLAVAPSKAKNENTETTNTPVNKVVTETANTPSSNSDDTSTGDHEEDVSIETIPLNDEELEKVEEDDAVPPVEPPVGLLIDLGSPQCGAAASKTTSEKEVPLPSTTKHSKQNGSTALLKDKPAEVVESVIERRGMEPVSEEKPSSCQVNTKDVAKPLVQGRLFNFAMEAYCPDFAQHATVEGSGNPKMNGQSNVFKPWLRTNCYSTDSDDEDDEDDDSGNEDGNCLKPQPGKDTSVNKASTYNPFPSRRLKSEMNRTRSRLKVGLYTTNAKTSDRNSNSSKCSNQQLESHSRGVKSGSIF